MRVEKGARSGDLCYGRHSLSLTIYNVITAASRDTGELIGDMYIIFVMDLFDEECKIHFPGAENET